MVDRNNNSSYASTSDGEEAGPSTGRRNSSGSANNSTNHKSNKEQSGSTKNSNRTGIKRQRVHFSCTECSRRKQRCNRETPCQHCIARKIPERCRTFQPGEDPNDLNGRVSRLEESVNDNFEKMFTMVDALIKKSGMNSDSTQIDKKPQQRGQKNAINGITNWQDQATNPDNQDAFGDQIEGSEAGDSVVMLPEQDPNDKPNIPAGPSMDARFDALISDTVDRRQGILYTFPLLVTDPMSHIEGSAQLDAVMREFGATFSVSQVLKAAMPPRELYDDLIDHFFIHNNWLRQPLSRKRVMKDYEYFWENGALLHAGNTNAYATQMIIAAIGCITYRGKFRVSDDPHVIQLTAKRMYFAARQALLISTMLGKEDIQQVVGFHLAARYLFLDRRVSEAWSCVSNCVRTALSIGLHRDGSLLNLSSEEVAARRRIWSIVYFGDRIICMNLGRPTAIDDDLVDTQLVDEDDPSGEFDEYLKPLPGAPPKPSGEQPKFLTFTRLRSNLAVLMGKVVKVFQNLRSPSHYSDVVALDHEIDAMHKTFPDHLRSVFNEEGEVMNCNTDWDDILQFVIVHRYLLQSELLFVRMSLHRTYVLRPTSRSSGGRGANYNSHHRYNFSRKACIEAAYQTLKLRSDLSKKISAQLDKTYDRQIPEWLSHLGTYNTTSAIVILGIYLLMEPDDENSERLFKPLKAMLDLHLRKRVKAGGKYDDTKEREFTILRLFVERIEEARSNIGAIPRSTTISRNRRGSETEVEGSQRSRKMARTDAGGKKSTDLRKQAIPALSKSHSTASGMEHHSKVDSSDQKSKDEDTASLLLDLNQSSNSRRKSAPIDKASQHAEEAGGTKGHQSVPWPYLPMQTPQTHTLHDSPLTYGSGSSSMNNGPTPPLMTANSSNVNSSNEGNGGASVLQMFESWFRYNAFEDIDSGALGSNSNGDAFRSNNTQGSSASASTINLNFQGRLPLPSSTDRTSNSNAQWSTLPLPTYENNTINGAQSLPQQQAPLLQPDQKADQAVSNGNTVNVFSGSDVMAGIGVPPGPTNTFFSNTPTVPNQSSGDQQNNISAASYDPAFWQSLIDKISG